jgi:MoaA/NifB/PqqE/SkfB family radical SAM enzyme
MLLRLLYSPFLAQLVVIRRCNLSCKYCNEFDETSPPVPFEVLRERIDKLKELGTFSLELTGGEPMMHPDIYRLVAYAKSLSFHKVMMISNAYLLNEEKVRKLNEAGLDEMQISVDGVNTNDVTIKVLDTLRPKLAIVARVARFKVVLSGVLGAAPPSEVLEVVAYAKEKGFSPRVLVIHDHEGQMLLSDEERRVFDDVRAALGPRYREARDYRDRLLRDGAAPFKCRAGSRYLYVDEHGDVYWCSQTRDQFRKPLLDYGYEDLKRQFHTYKGCAPTCTVGCVRTQSKADEWRPQDRPAPVHLPLARD